MSKRAVLIVEIDLDSLPGAMDEHHVVDDVQALLERMVGHYRPYVSLHTIKVGKS